MKRLFAFVAALLFIACHSDDVYTPTNKATRFHAIIEDASTRTFVDENIRLRWTAEDLITLFEGTTRNKKYKFLGETGDNAGDFEDITTGFGSGNDVNRYYALYPYASTTKLHEDGYITYILPAEQTYAENSFGLGANPMVAVTEDKNDYDLSFKNVCGYLRLYLYGDDVTIKSITIKGNDSEPIAGKAIITPTYGGNPTIEMDATATTTVTLNCGEGVAIGSTAETSTPFWIVLPPTTFADGFTLTITDTNDNEFTKSISSNVNIQRNKYLSARIEVEFPKPVPNNQIWYTAPSKVTPNNANVFGANIVSNDWNETTGEGVITFDGEVASIGEWAFANCPNLTSITIPKSVTSIGDWAFGNCDALTSIIIPNSVIEIGIYAFQNCDILKSVSIPNSVTSIGNHAFVDCPNLTSITIPDSITSIKWGTFFNCSALTNITIPNSVISIEGWAFNTCSTLVSITIPDSVTSIGEDAFTNCSALTNITIPNSVISIGARAFEDCVTLESVTIENGVKAIENRAFYGCSALTNITIPDSVTSIGDNAFKECVNLSSAIIGNGVTWIGGGAFLFCDALNSFYGKYASSDNRCLIIDGKLIFFAPAGLTTYNIPDGVTWIGSTAFYGCDALTSITIPDSVIWIGGSAFYDCDALQSITIPDGVTSIGYMAFNGCSALTSIYCKATTPPNQDDAFLDTPNLINIYVPSSSVDDYKSAWVEYADKIVGYDF